MNRKIVIIGIVVLASSGVMLGADNSTNNSQESYHVWTPEPELATAIACEDNDFGCEHPDDPNKHKEVPLPASVRTAICKITKKTFEDEWYEGPTKYAELFGPVYRVIVPDGNSLHLYIYQLKSIPWLSSRYYRIVLILYDVRNETISSTPVLVSTDSQSYCSRPWIRFQDVLGDSKEEILLLTGEHNGSDYNCMHQHIIQIESGINLNELGEIKTGITDYFPFSVFGNTFKEQHQYIVRIISKVDKNHFTAIVSYSKNKQMQGEIILGSEVYEVQENKKLSRTNVEMKGVTEDEIKACNEILFRYPGYF